LKFCCRFFDADTAGEKDSHRFKELIFEVFSISLTLLIGDFIPWLKWVTTVSGFKAQIKKAKGDLDSFLQTFLELKKSKLMKHQIQKKPPSSGTNEEHDGQRQFDQSAEEDFVGVLMAQPSEDGTGRLAEDSVKAVIQVI
jgi:hypothetical protein